MALCGGPVVVPLSGDVRASIPSVSPGDSGGPGRPTAPGAEEGFSGWPQRASWRGCREIRRARRGLVGSGRADGGAAQDQPGPHGFMRERIAGISRRRQTAPLDGLDLLDIGCGGGLLSEPFAARRGLRDRSGERKYRGGARGCGGGRGCGLDVSGGFLEALEARARVLTRLGDGSRRACADMPGFVAVGAWLPQPAVSSSLDPESYAEEFRAGDHWGRICARLAFASGHASMGAIRHAGRIRGGVACGGAPGEAAAGDGLRSAAAGVAAVAGFGGELLHDGGLVRRVVQNEVL